MYFTSIWCCCRNPVPRSCSRGDGSLNRGSCLLERGARLSRLLTGFRDPHRQSSWSFSTVPGSASQFRRSWSLHVFLQVRGALRTALSYLGKHPQRSTSLQSPGVILSAAVQEAGGRSPSPAYWTWTTSPHSVTATPVQRRLTPQLDCCGGWHGARTEVRPAAFRRVRPAPRRNGFAPESGGAAGSRGRRRPLVPRCPATPRTSSRQAVPERLTTPPTLGGVTRT